VDIETSAINQRGNDQRRRVAIHWIEG
jgi:hypothetical protein